MGTINTEKPLHEIYCFAEHYCYPCNLFNAAGVCSCWRIGYEAANAYGGTRGGC